MKRFVFAVILSVLLLNSPAAYTFTVDATERGWYNSDGLHQLYCNTITGRLGYYLTHGDTPLFAIFNSYFVFDLGSLSEVVTDATLRLELDAYESPDPNESFTVYGVTTRIDPDLLMYYGHGSTVGQSFYADLVSGPVYGTGQVSSSDVGGIIEINLSSDAISDINSSGQSLFAIGIALDNIGSADSDEWIRFSLDEQPGTYQLVLSTNGCAPVINKLKPRSCEPTRRIRIIGRGFGDIQGDSVVRVGNKLFDQFSPRIKLWSDTKIKIKIPNYKCEWFEGQESRNTRIWVTVDGIDSNKKLLKTIKPDTCESD